VSASNNSFFGALAGSSNLTGESNSFFGRNAGLLNLGGDENVFFGFDAGRSNTNGDRNAFFGANAGKSNDLGHSNAFYGFEAGLNNAGGVSNSFFGRDAGRTNNGSDNSFFGRDAGRNNSTGSNNVFVGRGAGPDNSTGGSNVFIGSGAGTGFISGSNNTVIGAGAFIPAWGNASSFTTVIGAGAFSTTTDDSVTIGRSQDDVSIPGELFVANAFGSNSDGLHVGGRAIFNEVVEINTLGAAGSDNLCRNASNRIASCSSSLRYKTNIASFISGLNLVDRLQPISFTWKDGGKRDLGLGAEDVEKVEPLLVTYNKSGQVEGVKYDRVAVVLLNAVKEQQSLIIKQEQQLKQQLSASLQQQRKLEQQQEQLDALRKLVCKRNPRAKACR